MGPSHNSASTWRRELSETEEKVDVTSPEFDPKSLTSGLIDCDLLFLMYLMHIQAEKNVFSIFLFYK